MFCNPNLSPEHRRKLFQARRLEFLKYFRDSLERRLAAVIASIDTLENQISRDEESITPEAQL